jgi:hypothetical protein
MCASHCNTFNTYMLPLIWTTESAHWVLSSFTQRDSEHQYATLGYSSWQLEKLGF